MYFAYNFVDFTAFISFLRSVIMFHFIITIIIVMYHIGVIQMPGGLE